MKWKCPKKAIRDKLWTRIPAPAYGELESLKTMLYAHESTGHFWYNPINTHWWIELPEDAAWIMLKGYKVRYK